MASRRDHLRWGAPALAGLLASLGTLAAAPGCNLDSRGDTTHIGGAGGQGGAGGDVGGGGAATVSTTTTGGTVCTPVDDMKECTDDVCEEDVAMSTPKAAGDPCASGVCDGTGECVECVETEDCGDPLQGCMRNTCIPIDCGDSRQNGAETDVDCGGPTCPPCADGLGCGAAADCESGVCADGGGSFKCQVADCDDGVSNGGETGVDCGGPCVAGDDKKCADGDGCGDPDDCVSGVCDADTSTCSAPSCGDGVINQPGEACDDGNRVNGDTCNNNCGFGECGDGEVGGTEQCDDGNLVDGDDCDSNCTPTGCGNGIVTGPEACDDGNLTSGDGCDDGPAGNCSPTACGNTIVTAGEGCDDGGTMPGDGCDALCLKELAAACDGDAECASSFCDPADDTCRCDGDADCPIGQLCDTSVDPNACLFNDCGNGIPEAGEGCDDGNGVNGDGCSMTCTVEILESEPNNACGAEDGPFTPAPTVNVVASLSPVGDLDFFSFTLPGPGVSSVKIETFTGVVPGACPPGNDTILELRGTNCTSILASDDDDGLNACSLIDAAGADTGARKLPAGTYFVGVGEFENNATIATYNVHIQILSTCGNGGAPETTEACDDGNLTNGDGCDANCTVSACGNAVKAGAEGCDDGNTANGDGCSSTCTVESGFTCMGTPSVCVPT